MDGGYSLVDFKSVNITDDEEGVVINNIYSDLMKAYKSKKPIIAFNLVCENTVHTPFNIDVVLTTQNKFEISFIDAGSTDIYAIEITNDDVAKRV